MTTRFSTCALAVLQRIRDELADKESFHVSSGVIEWLDEQIAEHDLDIHEWLAERSQIAVIWSIEDVQEIRPDLDQYQAWNVLQAASRYHDGNIGINWDVLCWQAHLLFGPEPSDEGGQP